MTEAPTDPHSTMSLSIALTDLAYVHGALMRDPDPTARWAFLQYAVMASFETRNYIERQLHVAAPDALWPEEMATAARMSGKYFDDKRRFLAGVEAYFAQLLAANRATFFPADRRAKWLDRWRNDTGVLLLDGVPMATDVGGYFSAGLTPDQLLDRSSLGPAIRDLAAGVGQTIAWVDADRTHAGPLPFDPSRFEWRDAKVPELFAQAFRGDFEPPMAAAMMTVQTAATAAHRLSQTACCPQCSTASFKHRLIVAYQSTVALRHLRDSEVPISAAGRQHLERALDDPACVLLLSPGYRKLRNGLLHLGLTDIPVEPGARLNIRDVLTHYTGGSPEDALATVEQALTAVTSALETWCLAAPPGGPGLLKVTHRP